VDAGALEVCARSPPLLLLKLLLQNLLLRLPLLTLLRAVLCVSLQGLLPACRSAPPPLQRYSI